MTIPCPHCSSPRSIVDFSFDGLEAWVRCKRRGCQARGPRAQIEPGPWREFWFSRRKALAEAAKRLWNLRGEW